jgi:hypothetical protein
MAAILGLLLDTMQVLIKKEEQKEECGWEKRISKRGHGSQQW